MIYVAIGIVILFLGIITLAAVKAGHDYDVEHAKAFEQFLKEKEASKIPEGK